MKKTSWLIVLWLSLNLLLLILWPSIREIANASRPCDAIGGEYLLWLLPTVMFMCLMPDIREEKK